MLLVTNNKTSSRSLYMKKFNIKKMYGYYWMIISFIIPFLFFIVFLGFTIYFKANYYRATNKVNANFVLIVLTCVDIFIALFCIGKLSYFLYSFLPFKNTNGKIVIVKITERSIFATMHGTIETEKVDKVVKVIVMSGGFKFLNDYNVGDYIECFIKEKDLSNPKKVVLYK